MFTPSFLLILTLAIFTSQQVAGQNPICTTENSEYNPNTKGCHCKEGFEGAGDLCCVKKNEKDVCFISGDPFLTSVNNVVVPLNSPCSVCLNVMEGKTTSGQECKWEILGSSSIQAHGAMYYDMLSVAIVVNKKPDLLNMYNGVLTHAENGPITLSAQGTTTIDINGADIVVSFDELRGLWTIEGCGNKAIFRPSSPNNTMGTPKVRTIPGNGSPTGSGEEPSSTQEVVGSPGLCMLAAADSTSVETRDGNICNLKPDFAAKDDLPFSVFTSAIEMRGIFNDAQLKSLPEFDEICRENVDQLFTDFCQGETGKEAIVQCGAILYQSVLRDCLYESGQSGTDIMGLFTNCLSAYCDGASEYCDTLKGNKALQSCYPKLLNCETWPFYFEN